VEAMLASDHKSLDYGKAAAWVDLVDSLLTKLADAKPASVARRLMYVVAEYAWRQVYGLEHKLPQDVSQVSS
jgi:hypothetical protein